MGTALIKTFAFAALIAATGCGRSPGKSNQASSLQAVSAQAMAADPAILAQPLHLAEAEGPLQFNASLVFFDRPSLGQVAGLLQKTFESRALKAEALRFVAEQLVPAKERVAAAQATYDSFDGKIRDALKNVNPEAKRAYVASVANSYLADRLSALVASGQVTADDQRNAEATWPGYCEAKLWELATSPQLGRPFPTRPTPAQFCESYYAARGYFTDASLCAPAPAASGKSYFNCLWQDGVFKSLHFGRIKPLACNGGLGAMASKGEALAAWLASGDLQQVLTTGTADDAGALQQAILTGDLLNRAFTRRHPAFANCRSAFAIVEPAAGSDAYQNKDWAAFRPTTLLAIGEANETDAPPFHLLPFSQNDVINKRNYELLTKGLKAFAERPRNRQGEAPSFSDTIFNSPVGGTPTLDPALADLVKADEAAVSADPAFAKLADFEPAEVKALRAQQALALTDLNAATATFAALLQSYQGHEAAAVDNNRLDTVTTVQSPGAAIFLNNYYLTVQKVANQFHVKIGFDLASKVLVGCAEEDGGTCDVPREELGDNGIVAKATFNKLLNLLSVEFELTAPGEVGFPVLPRQPGSVQFNDIPLDQLQGRTVRIDAFTSQSHGDQLAELTGASYILDNLRFPHYLGTVAGDNFVQREKATLPSNLR